MHRDPLQTLVHLVATEENPHQLILRVAADTVLLKEVQRLCRKIPGVAAAADGCIGESCRSSKTLPDNFLERLQLIARIVNILPYEKDYYEILGIDRSAGPQQIKHAFRRMSLSCHPDTNPNDPHAAERFRNIQHAYEVLSDELLRQSYDRNLAKPVWSEDESSNGGAFRPTWWQRWRRTWPFGVLFILLAFVTLVIDGRQWQTDYYYSGTPAPPWIPVTTHSPMEAKAPIAEDVDRRIHEFLSRFTRSYEAKDPAALLAFFEADAIENGRPIKELIPVYEASFQRATTISYRIDVRRWEAGEDEVMVDGNFTLSLQFWHETPVESTGWIQFTLIGRDRDFGVRRLNYSFNTLRKLAE